MSDELRNTVKIKLDRKARKDGDWEAVGSEPAEEIEFELVSTMMLKQILESDDDQKKDQIRGLTGEEDGVLVCSTESDSFEILADDELDTAIKASQNSELSEMVGSDSVESVDGSADEEDFSLVSTQLLRTILHVDDQSEAAPEVEDDAPGYNPYDKG